MLKKAIVKGPYRVEACQVSGGLLINSTTILIQGVGKGAPSGYAVCFPEGDVPRMFKMVHDALKELRPQADHEGLMGRFERVQQHRARGEHDLALIAAVEWALTAQ